MYHCSSFAPHAMQHCNGRSIFIPIRIIWLSAQAQTERVLRRAGSRVQVRVVEPDDEFFGFEPEAVVQELQEDM